MTATATRSTIADILSVDYQSVVIDDNTSFADDLHMDSLDFLSFVRSVEDRMSVIIPDEALGEVQTVGDLLKCIPESAA